MLEVKNLTKYFDEFLAVDNVSFSARKGDIIGFLGPNGAGKSTTMRIAAGYYVPNSGDVTLNDISITSNPEGFKAMIGYMPENNPLFTEMTVIEHIKFIESVRNTKVDKSKVQDYINKFGLHEKLHKKVGELSKGYRQRLGMLLALMHDPFLLILDEPNEGLDPNQREEIRNLIKELSKEKIIIISTHVLQEVESICNKVVIINKGKIQQEGNIDDLRKLRDNKTIHRVSISNAADFASKLKEFGEIPSKNLSDGVIEYTVSTSDEAKFIDEFNKALKKESWKLHELKSERLTIADLFKELTTDETKN